MTLLLLFLSIWIGLSFKHQLVISILLGVILLIFAFKRFGKKIFAICLTAYTLSAGISFIQITTNRKSCTGLIIEAKENYFLLSSLGEKFYIYEKNNTFEIGDIIKIEGNSYTLEMNSIESEFDFKNYLNSKNIYKQFYVRNKTTIFKNPIRLKTYKKFILSKFNSETADIVGSILFSDGEDDVITKDLSTLHLGRLVSTSGLYLYLFLNCIKKVMPKRIDDKWRDCLALAILTPYLIFVFPKFAALKLALLIALKTLNKICWKQKFSYLEILSISGLIFLIVDRTYSVQTGFILGYLLPLYFYFSRGLSKSKKKIFKKLKQAALLWVFFLPFELMFYQSIGLFSYLNQMILTPIFYFLSLVSLICLFNIPLFKLANFITVPIKSILSFMKIYNLQLYMPQLDPIHIVIYYLILIFSLYIFSIKYKPLYKYIVIITTTFSLLYILPIENQLTTSVNFINVGQGDSCLVRKGNHTLLIDTGGNIYKDIAQNSLIPYFKKNRIYKIDYCIITHYDYDHSGAFEALNNNFKIANLIDEKEQFPLNFFGTEIVNYNNYYDNSSAENDKSLVLGFNISKTNYLIMGDAPKKIENKIRIDYPNLKCDILKIGHHGSDTSSSYEFIEYLSPKEAIISVGKNNYGHPNQTVLSILKRNKIRIRRTDEEGTISYKKFIFV